MFLLVILLHLRSNVSSITFEEVDQFDELILEGVKFLISLLLNLIQLFLVQTTIFIALDDHFLFLFLLL